VAARKRVRPRPDKLAKALSWVGKARPLEAAAYRERQANKDKAYLGAAARA
jgi:hypothetical protein